MSVVIGGPRELEDLVHFGGRGGSVGFELDKGFVGEFRVLDLGREIDQVYDYEDNGGCAAEGEDVAGELGGVGGCC